MSFDLVFAWRNTPERERLFGRRCRLVARGTSLRSVLLEFESGERVVSSARAVRKAVREDGKASPEPLGDNE